MRITLALFVTLAIFVSATAHAQVVDDRAIIVTGKKGDPKKEAQRQLRQIVSTVDGQLARFAEPVCPLVAGLSPESGQIIAQRIRDVAAQAGAKVAPEKCDPNIVLIIAADADLFVTALAKRFPKVFTALRPGEMSRAKEEGPVHAWNTVEVRNEDGQRMDWGDPPTLEVRTASNITRPSQWVTLQSIVVIDDGAAVGKSLVQIGDYTAMRTLAGARPPREAGKADTILGLFDPGVPAPPELTALDLGFVTGLYAGKNNATARQKARQIAREVVKQQP